VQQITDDVIQGNSANATWTGGGSTTTALGNLSATSTATQASELVGKWFLGTDLPNTDDTMDGHTPSSYPTQYEATTLPLYGASGSPQACDVNQGEVGDCYFLASLAEVAQEEPNTIKDMITDNGNGTYAVEFQINGQADYVTVNNELPTLTNPNQANPNGSDLAFANGDTAWAPLIEKAFVELDEQSGVQLGAGSFDRANDNYAGISGGSGTILTELTGKNVIEDWLPSYATSTYSALLSSLSTDLASGQEIDLANFGNGAGSLIGGHMFEVESVDVQAGTITLHDPYGSDTPSYAAATFTETLAQLAQSSTALFVTSGKSAYGVA